MTIKQARKILGSDAKDISDNELLQEIELAEFFKDYYFSSSSNIPNKKLAELRTVYREKYPRKVSTTMVIDELMT